MGIINRDGALWMATGVDNSGLYSGLNQAENRINQFEAHIGKVGDSITRLTGVGLGVAGLKAFSSEIINVRGEMQMLESSFEVLLGGKGVSGFMSEMKQFAVDSPLSMNGVANAAQTLLGFGIAAEKVMPTIKQIGDISMGNEDRFKSLSLAFAQMSATGKLMGQDLLQMINAGFNPLMTISEKTGKSIGELKKDMESGAISSEMVADAFASATEKGGKFYGMTQKQAEGIRGLQAQLEGGLQDAYNNLGKSQEGLIAGGYKVAITLAENYEKVGKTLVALITTYGAYRTAVLLTTQAEAGWNIIQLITYNRLLLVERAQKLLNATMLANPYVAVTVLVVGLVAATWALYDATTTQEKAQKRLNEINEESKRHKEELTSQTEQYISVVNSETKSKLDQIIAYKELQSLFPSYLKNMDLATFKAMKLTEQQALLNNAMNENEANNLNNQLKELQSMYDRLNSSNGNGFGGLSEGVKVIDEIREKLKLTYDIDVPTYLKTQIDLLQKQRDEIQKNKQEAEIRNKPEAEQIKYINEQLDILNKKKSAIEEIAAKAESLPTPFQKMALKARDALSEILGINNEISRLQNWLGAIKGTTGANYQTSYKDAEKGWADAKKKVVAIKKNSKSTVAEYEKAIADEKSAKETFEKLGGQTKVDKSGESKAKKAQDIIDQNEKIKQLENKQSLDRKRQGEDLANQEIQARISAMQSGAEKIREQKELDNKLEIQALERQKEDYIQKIIQDEREKFDAQEELKLKKNPKYTKKTFDPSSYISNDAISNLSLQMNSLFQQKGNVDLLARPLVDAAKLVEKGWEDAGEGIATVFSSQFGILDKDGKEVEILITPILPNGDVLSPNELEDYIDNVLQGNDISKADNLGIVIGIGVDPDGEAGDQLHKLQAELLGLKEKYTSIDTSFFDNIIDSTKLRQQNDVLETDKQAWNEYLKAYGDYEDKRLAIFNEYREKIGKAQTQGEKALLAGNRDKELQDLDQTLIEKSDLWVRLFDDASKHTTGYITETIKKVQQLIDYMKGVEGVEIPIGFTTEQIESLKKDPEKVKEILKGLKTQVDELNTRNPFNSLIQGFKDLKKAGKDTEKQYTATNKIISGIQGVREVVGQLSTAFTDLGMNSEDSLAKVMNVMDRTASMAQTGAQIGGAWGAAIGGAIGLTTSLISAFKGKSKAQKDTEQLQDVTSKIETTNNSINRLLEKRIDLINEATAAEAGYLNTLTQEQIKQQQTYVQSMFDRLSGNEIFGKKGKNNNLSLSALMQKEGLSSMEEFVEWWNSNGVNKLIGEGYDLKNEDQWQSIVDSWEELSEAAENAEKAMKEAVIGISFDSLKDRLDDLVKSADTTFEDIGDSFNDHMRNAALKFAKSSYLTKALQDWYDKFAEYAQSGSTDDSFGLTPEETAELRKMYEDAYNKAQGLYDSALDAMGISKEDSDINGITGVAASITQDSANELNGNFYAVRQSLNDVRNINKQTQEYIKVQTGHISDVKEAVSSYKQVFADQLTYIKMTAENTAATASILREIRDNGLIMKR